MWLLYSKGCEYAVRALTPIPLDQKMGGFSVKSVCRAAGVPEAFTRKAFQSLVKGRILAARPGPGGGYHFRKDPRRVSVLDVIHAVDGGDAFEKCILKGLKCDKTNPCWLHPMWMNMKSDIIEELKKSTIGGPVRREKVKKEKRR